jgi:hypothetical protein
MKAPDLALFDMVGQGLALRATGELHVAGIKSLRQRFGMVSGRARPPGRQPAYRS